MSCGDKCPREMAKFHPASPGPVGDEEFICRSGFKDAMKADGKPRTAVVNKNELISGQTVSFWRALDNSDANIRVAEAKMAQHAGGREIVKNLAPPARALRDQRLGERGRIFSVLDDCTSDLAGGFDPLHCGVRLCQRLSFAQGKDDPDFHQVVDKLRVQLELYRRDLLPASAA